MSSLTQLLRRLILLVLALVFVPFVMMAVLTPLLGPRSGQPWHSSLAGGPVPPWLWLVALLVLVGIGYLLSGAVRTTSGPRGEPVIQALRTADARDERSDEAVDIRLKRPRRKK